MCGGRNWISDIMGSGTTIGNVVNSAAQTLPIVVPAGLTIMSGGALGPTGAALTAGSLGATKGFSDTGNIEGALKQGALTGGLAYAGGKALGMLGFSPAAVDSMMTAQGLEGAGAPAVETGSLLSVPVGGAAVPTASTYATLGSGWEGLPGAATTSGVPSSMSIELGLPEAWGGGLAATDAGASTATSIADILSTTGGEGAMTGFEWANPTELEAGWNAPTLWENIRATPVLGDSLGWLGNHPLTTARMFTNLMDIPGKLRKKGAYEDLADQLTGFRNEYLGDYNRAVENASWNDTKRTEYMKGIMGTISSNLEGTKRRLSANQAALGRGGGGYGKLVQDAMQKGREQAATARAETYKPQWFAPANTAGYDTAIANALAAESAQPDIWSSTAGDLATSLLSGLLSDKILSGLGSIFG